VTSAATERTGLLVWSSARSGVSVSLINHCPHHHLLLLHLRGKRTKMINKRPPLEKRKESKPWKSCTDMLERSPELT